MSGLLQDLRYALRQLRNAGIRRRRCDYFADVPHRGRTCPNLVMKPRPSDFLFRSFRHSLIPRYFEFRCLWISSNRCFRYSRYSCCNLGSLGEL